MSREPWSNGGLPQWPQGEPNRGRRYSALLVFGVATFAVLAFYGLVAVATQLDEYFLPGNEIRAGFLKYFPGIDSGENPEAADIDQRINILVLGLDRRLDEPKDLATRTDTVFVLTIDPFSKTAGVFSIPRDLWLDIPDGYGGFFQQRINVAYEFGENGDVPYPGGGAALAMDTVEHNFGIPIDHYVVLDFANFIAIIDELGGIDIDVPEYLYDPAYQDCNSCPYEAWEFLPGLQHMDGRTALAYARIREGSNDLERIERQQLVMRAMAEKASSINLLLPNNLISLYGKYKDAVKTDISDFKLPGLAKLASQIPLERIKMVSLGDAVYGFTTYDGASVLGLDREKAEELKRQLFLDGRLQLEAARIEVQNGTDVPGLATDVAGFLSSQGLSPASIALADNAASDLGQTLIYNVSGKDYTTKKLAEWLGLSENHIINEAAAAPPTMNGPADIVIIVGRDAALSANQAGR